MKDTNVLNSDEVPLICSPGKSNIIYQKEASRKNIVLVGILKKNLASSNVASSTSSISAVATMNHAVVCLTSLLKTLQSMMNPNFCPKRF